MPGGPAGGPRDTRMKDRANAGRAIGPLSFKAAKIVRSDEVLHGRVHRVLVET